MKHYIVSITITLVMTPIFPQQLFIEPEFGFYDPLEWTSIDIPDSGQGEDREIDFDLYGSLRFGANIGISFPRDNQVYIGYKYWSLVKPDTYLNTFVVGMKSAAYLKDRNLGIRLGLEYLNSNMVYESSYLDSGLKPWDLSMKGAGYSLEVGMVYKLFNRGTVFVGFDYLVNDVTLNKLTANKVIYTLTKLGLSESKATVNMNGFNIKMSISFILTNPLEFDD